MTTNAPLPPIQMLWLGGPLSTLERLSISSFLKNGHAVHLYGYGDIDDAPAGTTLCDAGSIIAQAEMRAIVAGERYGSWAPFSNIFRYKLLHERGGIWCDTDVVCVKPLDFAAGTDYFFATEFAHSPQGGQQRAIATTCAMRTPPGCALMKECFDAACAVDLRSAGWGASGVIMLREKLPRYQLEHTLLQPNAFCPVSSWGFTALLSGLHTLPFDTCAIHFYNEMWRRNFFDKDARYEPFSVYERLKAHYLGAS